MTGQIVRLSSAVDLQRHPKETKARLVFSTGFVFGIATLAHSPACLPTLAHLSSSLTAQAQLAKRAGRDRRGMRVRRAMCNVQGSARDPTMTARSALFGSHLGELLSDAVRLFGGRKCFKQVLMNRV